MKPKTKQQGFSLLEVLIALFMVAMMLVLYQSAISAIALSRNAKDQEIALRIASHKLEALRAAGYDALPSSGTYPFSDAQLSIIPAASGSFTVIDSTNRTKQVTVTTTWREPGTGKDHAVVLDTLITAVGGLK